MRPARALQGAQLGSRSSCDGADGPHAGASPRSRRRERARGLGERVEEGEEVGRALGDRVRAGASTVSSSPRAIGPVRARSGPSAAQFSTVARTSGTSAAAVDAGARGEPLGGGLERDEEVRGDRGGGVVGGAVLVGDVDRREAEVERELVGDRRGRAGVRAGDRGARRPRACDGPVGRDRHQRVQREGLVRGEHVERRGAGAVADERPSARGSIAAAAVGDLAVRARTAARRQRPDIARRGRAVRRRRSPLRAGRRPARGRVGPRRRSRSAGAQGLGWRVPVPVPTWEIPVGV